MLNYLKKTSAAVALTAGLVAGTSAYAAPITFNSGDAANEYNSITGTNVVITPHSAWGNVGGGASWISYANTGIGGFVAPNAATRTRPDATSLFTETLGFINAFSLKVLGDDTVTVDLVNLTTMAITNLFTAFAGQLDPCAPGGTGGGVGCVQADMGTVLTTSLTPGAYELRFYGFQTNNDVFGIQYTGEVNTADAVPEPMSLGLLGLGLLGMYGFVRRRKTQGQTV
jgi:hypothetical protein